MSTAAASRPGLQGAGFGTLKAVLPPDSGDASIGLLGGSFNPAHEGHIQISETALRRLGLDQLWWLVTPGNPLKAPGTAAPLSARVAQARRLIGTRPITVTTFERELAVPYTISTLQFLRRRRPQARFVWLMGADCLAEFHRWRQWRDIMALMPVAVIDRPGWRHRALASITARVHAAQRLPEEEAALLPFLRPPAWVFLTAPLSRASSTALRAAQGA